MGWNASERAEMNVVGRCPGRVAGAGRLRFSALTESADSPDSSEPHQKEDMTAPQCIDLNKQR